MVYAYFFRCILVIVFIITLSSCSSGGGGGEEPEPEPPINLAPNSFDFDPIDDVERGILSTSQEITVSGISAPVDIRVDGGEYSINGADFISQAGRINNNDKLVVQVISSSEFASPVSVSVNIAGVDSIFTVTTRDEDKMPDEFSFMPVEGVTRSIDVVSQEARVTGVDRMADIAIVGGLYSINGGNFTAGPGVINLNDTVRVQLTSAAEFGETVEAQLSIGGEEAEFMVTSEQQLIRPMAFSFTNRDAVELNTSIESEEITVLGINDAATFIVTDGQFSIDGSNFKTGCRTEMEAMENNECRVTNEQKVKLKLTSADTILTESSANLSIEGIFATFKVTTVGDTVAPTASIIFPPPTSMTQEARLTVRGTASDQFGAISAVQVNGVDVTDTSDDGSFASWRVSVPLTEGDNTLSVSTTDDSGNTNTQAAKANVLSNEVRENFPDPTESRGFGIAPRDMALYLSGDEPILRFIIASRVFDLKIASGNLTVLQRLIFDENLDTLWDSGAVSIFIDELAQRVYYGDDDTDNDLVSLDLIGSPESFKRVESVSMVSAQRSSTAVNAIARDLNDSGSLVLSVGYCGVNRFTMSSEQVTPLSFTASGNMNCPRDVLTDIPDNNVAAPFIGDIIADPGEGRYLAIAEHPPGELSIIAIDPSTGQRTMVSSAEGQDQSVRLSAFSRLQLIDDNRLLASSGGGLPSFGLLTVDRTSLDSLTEINLQSGERSVFLKDQDMTKNRIDREITDVLYDPRLGYLIIYGSQLDVQGSFPYEGFFALDLETKERVYIYGFINEDI